MALARQSSAGTIARAYVVERNQTPWKVSHSLSARRSFPRKSAAVLHRVAFGLPVPVSRPSGKREEVALRTSNPRVLGESTFCRAGAKKETTRRCGHTLKSTPRMRESDRAGLPLCLLKFRKTSKSRPASPGKTTKRMGSTNTALRFVSDSEIQGNGTRGA
jgi:hypothetical protein